MFKIRRSHERGQANYGWLDTKYSFSFADYYDPEHMGFGPLRVINEDLVAGGGGFPTHPHRDMEIITYIVSGILEHKDSMGNTAIIRPNEVQYMSAGTGVRHSEFNPQAHQSVHLLQIWIVPDKINYTPSYGQKSFVSEFTSQDNFVLVASDDGRMGSIKIHQAIDLYAVKSQISGEKQLKIAGLNQWIQVIFGELVLNEQYKLQAGDGIAISKLQEIKISWISGSEFLFFDMDKS